jgi:cysteine synthase B
MGKEPSAIGTLDIENQIQKLEPFIGHTPLYPLHNILPNPRVNLYAKLEWQQLGGSVKARPAFQIIKDAIRAGNLDEDKMLLDASSGNTGIAYAAVARSLGLSLTLCMPENASEERKLFLKALGSHIVYTSAQGSTDEAQERAVAMTKAYPDYYYYADQYGNASNWQAHYYTTASEIIEQTNDQITHLATGLGTTGTFIGTGRGLRAHSGKINLVALHPSTAMHGLEGWKHMETAKIPEFYDPTLADENRTVSSEQAYEWVRKAAQLEGLLISPSAAANLAGAYQLATELDEGTVVTVFPDGIEKYRDAAQTIFNTA